MTEQNRVIPSSNRKRAVTIACFGGGLELYDFTIYIFFAPIIATLFFPAGNEFISLLETFIVFAVGYLSRPLGAILFGHYGDKTGRKKGLLITILLMGLSTAAIGLLPTYNRIGIFAPLLLVILRFAQGLAVGGDLPGAITFVAEYSANHTRGFLCSLVYCGVNIGLLLASGVGTLLTLLLTHEQLMSWGWRIAFIAGLSISIIGFYLRRKIEDTPHFHRIKQTQSDVKTPIIHLFQRNSLRIFQSIGLAWLFAVIIAQIFLYMPTYLRTEHQFKLTTALFINSINILIFSLSIPVFGYISDKVGRKLTIFIGAFLFFTLSYPLYALIDNSHFAWQLCGIFGLGILAAIIISTTPSALSEMFPTPVRYSGVGITYNLSVALFASSTPIIATFLLYKLQFIEAPSLNLMLSALVTGISVLTIKEMSCQSLEQVS